MTDLDVPILRFMLVRPPAPVPSTVITRAFLGDDVLITEDGIARRFTVDLQSETSPSGIGQLVYRRIFCAPAPPSPDAGLAVLRQELLATLPAYSAYCPANFD